MIVYSPDLYVVKRTLASVIDYVIGLSKATQATLGIVSDLVKEMKIVHLSIVALGVLLCVNYGILLYLLRRSKKR